MEENVKKYGIFYGGVSLQETLCLIWAVLVKVL
jgi:hypothetical protein